MRSGEGTFSVAMENELMSKHDLLACLGAFPDHAVTNVSFGDLTIADEYKRACELNQGRRVYIWSLDAWLAREPRSSGPALTPHHPHVPAPPLNGPTTFDVIHPP
jgi:hypothetical protein